LIRRLGDKNVVLAGMALMIVGGVLTGVGTDYALLLVGRVLSGTGGATLVVAMLKMIIDWFAEKELFFGMAVFIIGWPIGIAAAQASQSRLAQWYSWHAVFNIATGLVAVALVLMLLFYRLPPAPLQHPNREARGLTPPELRMACLAGAIWMFLNGAYLVILSFGPAELTDGGMPIPSADAVVSVMSWVFIVGLPLGGYVANRYNVPDGVMIGGLVAAIVLGAHLPFSPAPLASFALFGAGLAVATPVVAALPARMLPPELRGPGFGVYYLWYFAGMPVLITFAGLLRDATRSAKAPLVFAVAMLLCCLLLVVIFRLARGRLEQRPQA
jgi:predicted MFS family arabinose efflux permease